MRKPATLEIQQASSTKSALSFNLKARKLLKDVFQRWKAEICRVVTMFALVFSFGCRFKKLFLGGCLEQRFSTGGGDPFQRSNNFFTGVT